MVGRDNITPSDIGKHKDIIKAAQEEFSTMDVLVCGRCLTVFHFIEEFKIHKSKPCRKDIGIRNSNPTQPKIWAFNLWKAAKLAVNKDLAETTPNSWIFYQSWAKMDESLRETWIVAGKTIQNFNKIAQGNLNEMPVKITKTVVNNNSDGRKPLGQTKPQLANFKPVVKSPMLNKSPENDNTSPKQLPITRNLTLTQDPFKKPSPTGGATGQVQQNTITTSKTLSRRGKRSVPNSESNVEENIEKIVAKRYNPRRKGHEYLVKWETRGHDENTWEPANHLDKAPHLLDLFEKQLAKQKETRAAVNAKQTGNVGVATKPLMKVALDSSRADVKNITMPSKAITSGLTISNNETTKSNPTLTIGIDGTPRPSRLSKTKALDNVKQWASANDLSTGGNDSGQENQKNWNKTSGLNVSPGIGSTVIKRKLTATDFDDSNDLPSTTVTMEDLEEDLIPSHTVKRLKNGNAVSVEIKTRCDKNIESKIINVNGEPNKGGAKGDASSSGPKSAEIVVTKDKMSSGVVKREGFEKQHAQKTEAQIRVISKGEAAVSSTGIVRASSENSDINNPVLGKIRSQQVRVVGGSGSTGRQTPPGLSVSTTTITPRPVNPQIPQQIRTSSGTTIIQRKVLPATQPPTTSQRNSLQVQTRPSNAQQPTTTIAGRTIIPSARQTTTPIAGRTTATTAANANKTVTPEQKIFQLSKSGDLKVTKKVMTREDAVAQRLTSQQRQQMQRQQQQSQVQIQKVQQIMPPNNKQRTAVTSVSVRKQPDGTYTHEEQPLCNVTGKNVSQEDHSQLQSGVMQTQLVTEQQVVNQDQELNDMDGSTILINSDQILTNEDGTPVLVTGEDGTIYQVAGKNSEGQTLLVSHGADGTQQFAYVASSEIDDSQVLSVDSAIAEAVSTLPSEQQTEAFAVANNVAEGQYLVKATHEDGSTQMLTMTEAEIAQHQALSQQQTAVSDGDTSNQLSIQTGESQDGNIPAEVVQADPPSPGGTRRVVLLLQDGNFMMTEMHDDEFKALNIQT